MNRIVVCGHLSATYSGVDRKAGP